MASNVADLSKVDLKADGFKGRKVLMSGGAGFLGSWLCETLLLYGAKVTCVDDLSTGLTKNINHLRRNKAFRFIQSDVSELHMPANRFDYVLHLASRASPEEYQQHPIETLITNSQGTQILLEIARKSDAPLLYASSSEVYGEAEIIPTPETYAGKVDPLGARSCYEEGKRFGEALCIAYHKSYGLDTRIIRIFNTYGPRIRADGIYARVIPRFIKQALKGKEITVYGDGSQTRSFCYVTDTITAILKMLQAKSMKEKVVNIGNPEQTSILTLAKKIKSLTNSKSRITFHPRPQGDPQRRCPDITRAREKLNWQPKVTLEEGLQKTITWFRGRV